MLVDIDVEVLDAMALASLKDHYKYHQQGTSSPLLYDCIISYDKKLLKALKRVIEYYGGSVDNE